MTKMPMARVNVVYRVESVCSHKSAVWLLAWGLPVRCRLVIRMLASYIIIISYYQ